jgi:hypothetical protein
MVLLGLDQDIAQDWHGGFGADHVEDLSKAIREMIAVDFEFHGRGVRADAATGEINKG